MKSLAVTIGLSVLLTAGVAAAAPSPQQLDLARRYIDATHMSDSLASSMKAVRPMLMTQAGADLAPDQRTLIEESMDKVYAQFLADYVKRMEPILAEVFSQDELTQLVAFYESTAGKALLAKGPELQSKVVPLVTQMAPELQDNLKAEICARTVCGNPPAPPKRSA